MAVKRFITLAAGVPYWQEEWPMSEKVLKAKSPNLPNWTVNNFFYCTVYYITLNSNCEAQRASKNLKKIVEDRVWSQK